MQQNNLNQLNKEFEEFLMKNAKSETPMLDKLRKRNEEFRRVNRELPTYVNCSFCWKLVEVSPKHWEKPICEDCQGE